MKVTILGSGSSGGVPLIGNYWGNCNPSNVKNNRTRVSVLVSYSKKNILIDTSPDLRVQSIKNKINSIDAVLWTHSHADHANGIDDLRQFLWRRKNKLPVYASKKTFEDLNRRFDYIFEQNNSYFQPPLKVNIIKSNQINVCGLKVNAFKQHHGNETTLGFKFNNFVYSTDVKSFPVESEKYLYNLDLWIIDCVRYEPHYSHSHFDQTISWIKKFKPKKAILTHLGAWLDYEELLSRCPKNVKPAYDGLSINLT